MTPLTAAEQLGYYSVAVALAEVLAFGFGAIREIAFSRAATTGDVDAITAACRLGVLVMLPGAVVGGALAPWGVPLVFGRDFAPAVPMTQVLLLAALPAGLATLGAAGLATLGRPGAVSMAQAAIAVFNVALVVILVPRGGGMGASLASLVTYVVLGCVTLGIFLRASRRRWRDVLLPRRADVLLVLRRR